MVSLSTKFGAISSTVERSGRTMGPQNSAPTFQGVVSSSYIDHMGHMNVQYYVSADA